jgi:acetyl-CoA carboxylase carboxyltransferase component
MFLTGPAVVREVMGEDVSAADLGGPKVHERNGVAHFVATTDADAALLARDLLDHLPANAGERAPQWRSVGPVGYDAGEPVPEDERRVYDIRDVIRGVVDAGRLLEWSPKWAKNIVCGFARMDGRPVGVIANQPKFLGGVLDSESASKGARFVRTCNAFGLPLVVLVDTPGFLPGTKQEAAGVIRHGAKLLHAFAEAVVPKVTVVLRKAYGGAYICMNSKDLGADLSLAWPDAEIGIMGPKQAVGIVHKRALAEADDPVGERDRLADAYANDHVSAVVAARQGFVDELVEPRDTRRRLAGALGALSHAGLYGNGPGNIPL